MKLSTTSTTTAVLAATTASAGPTRQLSGRGLGDTWTVVDMVRTCDSSVCTWTFSLDAAVSYPEESPDRFPMPCSLPVYASDDGAIPPTEAVGAGACEWFELGSTYDPNGAFTTLSIVDRAKGWIAYPSYDDYELVDGEPVRPDVAETVQPLPALKARQDGLGDTWTVQNMVRTCDAADAECSWVFEIDAAVSYPSEEEGTFPLPCTYYTYASGGVPASKSETPVIAECRWFDVQSGYSDETQATTMTVLDPVTGWIIYPTYEDGELMNGEVVREDKSEVVQPRP